MASLSRLFSDNLTPYVDSRFVERLFVVTTSSHDIGRADASFDAIAEGKAGVGIKTFVAGAGSTKREKIAEFTSLARNGHFAVPNKKALVSRVAIARNTRVLSDLSEFGLDLDSCLYHCLIRFPGGAIVHEEPYQLIDMAALKPTDSKGRIVSSWNQMGRGVYFTDGNNNYSYSTSKNVLMKQFHFNRKKNIIPLDIHPDPMSLLNGIVGRTELGAGRRGASQTSVLQLGEWTVDQVGEEGTMKKGKDFVILPLYSVQTKEVPAKSGINQWNAGGRDRKFGEAYVPVPSIIHRLYPSFFPARNVRFDLVLPNMASSAPAKICQDGGKALMTKSNAILGRWIVSVLDPSIPDSEFDEAPRRRPFTYDDLVAIGKDSVVVRKERFEGMLRYQISFAPLGSFEEFIES